MNRKNKTVKQLQAECKNKKVGFMMNWTKAALVKRLEDEDNREKTLAEAQKELVKTKKQAEKDILATKDQAQAEAKKNEAEILKAQKETAQAEERLDDFKGAKKPSDISAMLEGERGRAQVEYDTLHEAIDKISAQKAEIGAKFMEAKRKLEHIDEAIATIKRVL